MQISKALECTTDYFIGDLDGKEKASSPFQAYLATKDGSDIVRATLELPEDMRRHRSCAQAGGAGGVIATFVIAMVVAVGILVIIEGLIIAGRLALQLLERHG